MKNNVAIHRAAMDALAHGDFAEAQRLFYLNCAKFPSYQSFNNLGLYLYDNGMNTKNNTTRSATKIGEHYIKRALKMERHPIVLNNLGRIAYERGEYSAAYQYYSQSYELVHDDAAAHNMAVTLFCLHRYEEAYSILKDCKDKLNEALLPYLFSAIYTNETGSEDFSATISGNIDSLDGVDQLLLWYLCGEYDKIVFSAEEILSDWWLDQEQWAVMIDSFMQCKEEKRLENIVAKYVDQEYKQLRRRISEMTQDALKRKSNITRCFDEIAFPIIVLFGYSEE